MIEFDVDMGCLLEEGELDRVVLNDENGEHEPMEFTHTRKCTIMPTATDSSLGRCSECGRVADAISRYCWMCGAKVVSE